MLAGNDGGNGGSRVVDLGFQPNGEEWRWRGRLLHLTMEGGDGIGVVTMTMQGW